MWEHPARVWSFTKDIPAPSLVSPANAHPNIHIPTFEWQAVAGCRLLQGRTEHLSHLCSGGSLLYTYNTRVTPVNTLAHGTHYWRVSGVDADGHVGTPSAGWSFTKTTDSPVLVSPGVNASVTHTDHGMGGG